MYNDNYGYRSSINETIKADLKEITDKGLELVPNATTWIDVGANDGQLLSNVPKTIRRIAYEPVNKFYDDLSKVAEAINGYFPDTARYEADIISIISCFYDFSEPNEAVEGIKRMLKKDGVCVIQQNYLKTMLENTAYDNICHEHVMYYSLGSLITLLNRHDLIVFRVEQNSINGGSIRTYICHKGNRDIEQNVWDVLKAEKDLTTPKPYQDFAERVSEQTKLLTTFLRLNKKTTPYKTNKVYAYGASTRGAVILQHADLARYIDAVVERNPEKIGKKYFGIPIISEAEAKKNPPDYALILPWFHPNIAQRVSKQTPSAKIIIPLPTVQVLEHKDIYIEQYL